MIISRASLNVFIWNTYLRSQTHWDRQVRNAADLVWPDDSPVQVHRVMIENRETTRPTLYNHQTFLFLCGFFTDLTLRRINQSNQLGVGHQTFFFCGESVSMFESHLTQLCKVTQPIQACRLHQMKLVCLVSPGTRTQTH